MFCKSGYFIHYSKALVQYAKNSLETGFSYCIFAAEIHDK